MEPDIVQEDMGGCVGGITESIWKEKSIHKTELRHDLQDLYVWKEALWLEPHEKGREEN